MSSTRYADPGSPLSQERYMSDVAFAKLRPISGTAVAARCALLTDPADRQLIWFIQGLTILEGGAEPVAERLIDMFRDRTRYRYDALDALPEYLTEICINPDFSSCGEVQLPGRGFEYIDDIKQVLVEFKRRYEDEEKARFYLTDIGRQIWAQLDYALKTREMIAIQGREGRGKTETAKAWCRCHLGEARFSSLKGTCNKTSHFRALAASNGVGHSQAHSLSHMQATVEDVVNGSGLMQVLDEAHFCFSQGPRMRTRPEMLDWIDTALCNPPTAVALITTPQFMTCMERAATQVGWNYRQFKRRCKRYCRLPEKNSQKDIEGVIRHLLPGADKDTVKMIVSYDEVSKRDLSGVGDVVREAKLLAESEGAQKVTFDHVNRAVYDTLLPSDLPWAEMEARIRSKQRSRKLRPEARPVVAEALEESSPDVTEDFSPRLSPLPVNSNRTGFRQSTPALVDASG